MAPAPVNESLRPLAGKGAPFLALVVLLALLGAQAALADEGSDLSPTQADSASDDSSSPIEDRWLPSVAVQIGLLIGGQSATGRSFLTPPDAPEVDISGSETALSPQIPISIGLETPEVLRGVRVFASAGIAPTIAFSRDLAKFGDPTGIEFPRQAENGDPYPEAAILGTGMRATAQIDPLAWEANFGVSITREIGDRSIVFRPSFGWHHFVMNVEGARLNAIKPDFFDPTVRTFELMDSESRPYDAIGPHLEVGVDLGTKGQFKPTLFLGAGAYYVLGDRTIGMSDQQSDGQGTETSLWEIGIDEWAFRLGVGIRVAWIGK